MGTKNEEKAIAKVIGDIRRAWKGAEIVVVDGSTDRTPEIAERLGARVIRQKPQGYGVALRTAILAARGDVIITMDCDDTYPAEAIPDFIEAIKNGCDVVSGSRFLGKGRIANMSPLNQFGNRMFALLTSLLYGISVTDVTTGMRAFRREVIHSFDWTENVGLSLELLFKPAAAGYKIKEIPIDYKPRVGEVKLNPLTGGLGMLKSILKYRISGVRSKKS